MVIITIIFNVKCMDFCSSMLYTPLIHLIFLPSLTNFKNILHPESLEKGHNGNNPNLCVWKIMDISREKSVFPIPGFIC